ncbi:phage-related protein [Hydrogenispora ethanolica]|uniref:Phage-related protein n=1 Tax=Hydrogenispora ethanolica TaxID=1082276 RepID=A0A4R1SB94_HYDET|nr:DUF1833 family protein [Hydrogenispora ethanolica]TCL76813.1 phage-related protein [Hydrogenispora ethanolica]
MQRLPAAAILEKNRLASDSPFLVLLRIDIPDLEPIRVVHNNEDIEWPAGSGDTWTAFPFQLDEITEDGKELSRVDLKVCNIDRTISQYLEDTNGATGTQVTLYVVHAAHLDAADGPLIRESFAVQQTRADANWVVFTLGPDFTTIQRVPARRYLADFCPFSYGPEDPECGVSQAVKEVYPDCPHTLDGCRARQNAARFGGEPTLNPGGFYRSNEPVPSS